ncbi:biotin carboxylase subunit of acetyl CoA carboxylase, putative [Plasmodium vinckei]|uniref:Biotin carboxylase subunit of acetyl CoA carboxylase, putative n=1 Tax=Plasmodium vinckei TaxID=5860 RepID=A0A6V7TBH3_PLAVN|nr:biotin carboxylase subunit of acetyl CoA carboxylase, putative [Plasmodium vinckei]
MISIFLSILLFVLIFENPTKSIKIKNNYYMHMYNNVNVNNFAEKETRDQYPNKKGPNNVLPENYRNKFMPLFVSKGTNTLNSIFKNKTARYIYNNSERNTQKNSKNNSKSSAFLYTLHKYSNALSSSFKSKSFQGDDFNIEKLRNNNDEDNDSINNVSSRCHSYDIDKTYSYDNVGHNLNEDPEERSFSSTSNRNYAQSDIRNDSNCSYITRDDLKKKNNSINNGEQKVLENLIDNFSNLNVSNNIIDDANLKQPQYSKEFNSYIKSQNDQLLHYYSDSILEHLYSFKKFNTKNKKKKNLNKLFYSFKPLENIHTLKKRTINVHPIQNSVEKETPALYSEKNGALVSNINKRQTQFGNKRIYMKKNDTCERNENEHVDDTEFLTYEETNNIKKKAYRDYINYINERRYPYINYLKTKNEKIIKKLLIANNGMAALKCILSLKEWLFKTFNDENLIQIIVLATEDDIKSNSKYISLSDKVIKVPPGKNSYNYANVSLIVDIAKKENVDAVWPGWGHCSENPLLSSMLEKENIIFIGPTDNVMEALGDKISANILAQSVNVPVVKWSGDNLKINDFENNSINQDIYDKSTVHSLEECISECKRIGYPVMIKASQGGGGKGIRKVENENEIKKYYEQVQNELPNSPIFLMKVCSNVRHIEIQVVGDMYGNVCSLSGRDCTTQRRFQKIFEEGPPSIVPPHIFREMEKASIRLTKMIKYRGAGTIEYLYDQINNKYYFLELNTRLQVEHPVSEGITDTNIVAIQLQVAMGIPLQNIDDIKKLYKIEEKTKKNTSSSSASSSNDKLKIPINEKDNNSVVQNNLSEKLGMFDFYNNMPHTKNHVIAARITAENSNDSFKPTSGLVKNVNFQNSKDVWGYFSINNGFVHEFSDSQIGHIFAKGETREMARKNLILALRKLNIDGEIKTVTKYLAKILESKAFIDNNITTNWLDVVIERKKNIYYNTFHIIILCAAIFKLLIYFMKEMENMEDSLNREDIAIKSENSINDISLKGKMKRAYIFDIIFQNVKYMFKGYNTGEDLYKLNINDQEIEILAKYDKENNKIFASFHNQTYIYTCIEDSLGTHMNLGKDNVFIPVITNPYHLISNTNGKIVKYLIKDGEKINKFDDYIEVEAMKMIMTFKSTETGILKHKMSEGAMIKIGDLLGVIEKEKDNHNSPNDDNNNKIIDFIGHLNLSNKNAYELDGTFFPGLAEESHNNEMCCNKIKKEKLENLRKFENSKNDKIDSTKCINSHSQVDTTNESVSVQDIKTESVETNENQFCTEDEQIYNNQVNRRNKLFLKKKNRENNKNNMFRLFSQKNDNNNKIMDSYIESDPPDDTLIYDKVNKKNTNNESLVSTKKEPEGATNVPETTKETSIGSKNYLNEKLNSVKKYLTNLNLSITNTINKMSTTSNEELINDNSENNLSTTNTMHNDSIVNSGSNDSLVSQRTNNISEERIDNSNNFISYDNYKNQSYKGKKVSTEIDFPVNSEGNNLDKSKIISDTEMGRSIDDNSQSSRNRVDTNCNEEVELNFDNRKDKGNEFFLELSNTKRIEYLLKGYEQDYEKCFEIFLKDKNNFDANLNYILDKFIEYNHLFSKKEIISEVEIYSILYNSISDKKKQYEVIHAYTYNYLSIKFLEKILNNIINNKKMDLPLQILNKIKILKEFKGKIFGSIILLSRYIIYLYEQIEKIHYLESSFQYNKNMEDMKKQSIQNYIRLLTKSKNMDNYKIDKILNNTNYEEKIKFFLKSPYDIHYFLPLLFKTENYNYQEILNTYLCNLYKYSTIKAKSHSPNCLLFSINNHEYNNAILNLNEGITIEQFKSMLDDILYKMKSDMINNLHIINKNEPFFNSLQNYLDKAAKKVNTLYIYNYFGNKYSEIHKIDMNTYKERKKVQDNHETNPTETNKNDSTINSKTHLLPFEEEILTSEDIAANFELKNVGQEIFNKTKISLGVYKQNNKYTSLFAQRIIDINDLQKQFYSGNAKMHDEHKQIEMAPNGKNNILLPKNIEKGQMSNQIYDLFMSELKESIEDISTYRLNPSIQDIKISSNIIYHIVLPNNSNIKDQINGIKQIYKNFLNEYNELFIDNYVNNVYIKVYTEIKDKENNETKLELNQLLKLHVLFDNEKEVIEQVDKINPVLIDTLYLKRKRARDVDTIYAYDFVKLINIALNRINNTLNDNFNYINSVKEFKLDYSMDKHEEINDTVSAGTKEKPQPNKNDKQSKWLFENFDNLSNDEIRIKKSLYLSNSLEIGQNKLSVIGLLMNVKTDEYKEGRDIVFIINDITTNGGAFSVLEDELFYGVSCYAREKKIPRISISCNSGAKIGLYNHLMDKIKVCWNDENKKELGYKYLYITEEIKEQIPKKDIIYLREIYENGEKRYIIDAIVGNLNNHIGVENLRGSGLIAGETSKAYDEIFTLSYVTGRSVGIGAYLVRLGKRTIQKKGSSLLLTGFNALNKILGEKVYISNEQLGGVNIMMKNGISQLEAENDQDGVDKIFKWLSYVPKTSDNYFDVFGEPTKLIHNKFQENSKCDFRKSKNISNSIDSDKEFNNYPKGYTSDGDMQEYAQKNSLHSSSDSTTFEPENVKESDTSLMHINEKNCDEESMNEINDIIPDNWNQINDIDMDNVNEADIIELLKGSDKKQGFLDKNSYFEYMNEWGKGIITGRGKLGSIPIGFIAVNKNLVTQTVPCDPALKTKAIKTTNAPCVFVPDNSYKTAQSIEDFNKENLPLFVFANWRGFSGGTMDMFNSILKFGSMIVNQLVNYKHPVFVYIPILGELRGGSWVVVDETLNSQIIEMYADTNSKGGILEPPGLVEVKFKFAEIKKLMNNSDPYIIELNQKLTTLQNEEEILSVKKEIEKKEKEMLPFYLQVCHKYADLHDVSSCMKEKGVIRKIVPWEISRSFFYYRLLRRLILHTLNKKFGDSYEKSDEIKNIIDDLKNSESDDKVVCKRVLTGNVLKNINKIKDEILHKKTLDGIFKEFQNLSKTQKMELYKKIRSYEF